MNLTADLQNSFEDLKHKEIDLIFFDKGWVSRDDNHLSIKGSQRVAIVLHSIPEIIFDLYPKDLELCFSLAELESKKLDLAYYHNGVSRSLFPNSLQDKQLFSSIKDISLLYRIEERNKLLHLIMMECNTSNSLIIELYDSNFESLELSIKDKIDAHEYLKNTADNMIKFELVTI